MGPEGDSVFAYIPSSFLLSICARSSHSINVTYIITMQHLSTTTTDDSSSFMRERYCKAFLMEIVVRFAYSVVKKWLSLQGFQKKIWPNLFSTRRPGVVSIKFKAKWLCIVLAYWLAVINVICVLCIIVDEYPMFVCKKKSINIYFRVWLIWEHVEVEVRPKKMFGCTPPTYSNVQDWPNFCFVLFCFYFFFKSINKIKFSSQNCFSLNFKAWNLSKNRQKCISFHKIFLTSTFAV